MYNYRKAIEYYEKAIYFSPKSADSYVNMGACYGELHDEQKMLECYRKAAELGDKETKQWLKDNGFDN